MLSAGETLQRVLAFLCYFISKLCTLLENWHKLPQAQSRHHSCLGIIKAQGMLQGEDKGDGEGGAEPGLYSTEKKRT